MIHLDFFNDVEIEIYFNFFNIHYELVLLEIYLFPLILTFILRYGLVKIQKTLTFSNPLDSCDKIHPSQNNFEKIHFSTALSDVYK